MLARMRSGYLEPVEAVADRSRRTTGQRESLARCPHSACHAPRRARARALPRRAPRPAPARRGHRRGRARPAPGCACAASSRSRRPTSRKPRRPRSAPAHDVEPDLRARCGGAGKRTCERRTAAAAHATGPSARRARAPLRRGARPRSSLSEQRKCPGRPAELCRQHDRREARTCIEDGIEPAGGLEAEGRRHGLLEGVLPAIGVSRCTSASRAQAAATPSTCSSISWRAVRATSIAAVSRTSWLVAPKCTQRAASPPTCSRSARTSGSTGFRGAPLLAERVDVEAIGNAGLADCSSRLCRHDACERLHLRERALDLEHRPEPCPVGNGLAQWRRHEEGAEGRQCSKNTVAPSPCIRMSK